MNWNPLPLLKKRVQLWRGVGVKDALLQPDIDERILKTIKRGIIKFQNAVEALRNARMPRG